MCVLFVCLCVCVSMCVGGGGRRRGGRKATGCGGRALVRFGAVPNASIRFDTGAGSSIRCIVETAMVTVAGCCRRSGSRSHASSSRGSRSRTARQQLKP